MLLNCGAREDSWESFWQQGDHTPKGNQPWVFTGRTDVEAVAPILWPLDAKSQLTWKDSDVGKDWGQEEKGLREDGMVRCHQQLNGHKFEQALGKLFRVKDREACCTAVSEVTWPSNKITFLHKAA